MHHRHNGRQRSAEDGISEVVGFVVILAVVVAAISVYLTYGVPVLGREDEIKEMASVRGWFVDYKAGVDQLWLNSPLEPGSADAPGAGKTLFDTTIGQVTLRKVIDPGTIKAKGFVERYLPLLAPIPSSGAVSVKTNERFIIEGKVGTNTDPTPIYDSDSDGDPGVSSLVYTSNNYYWFQQEYYYELGGVFLHQWDPKGGADADKVTLIAAPPISVYDPPGKQGIQTKVEVVAVDLHAEGGGVGSTSPIRVETRLDGDPAPPVGEENAALPTMFSEVTLTFTAASPQAAQAWATAFRSAASTTEFDANEYSVGVDDNEAWITITGPPDSPPGQNDVVLDVLVVDCTLGLDSVPTLIE